MDVLTEAVLAQIPYLRRFARALTGDVVVGDALVADVIEEMLSGPQIDVRPDERGRIRPMLLRAVVTARGPKGAERKPGAVPAHPLEQALDQLAEPERRAFLLVTLEALAVLDASFVLDIPEPELRAALSRARDVLGDSLGANILIVEDDAVIARDLAETVSGMGHRVCGIAATPEEAMDTTADDVPTLALIDLHLAHGTNGKQTAQRLRGRHAGLPVIFVTAYAEELERDRGFALDPVIRKPFTRDQIETAISQAVFAPREAVV
jgi:CheY-like chemotaxis protein/DNA-directed RNA polymerase specialized sigma24 family protein